MPSAEEIEREQQEGKGREGKKAECLVAEKLPRHKQACRLLLPCRKEGRLHSFVPFYRRMKTRARRRTRGKQAEVAEVRGSPSAGETTFTTHLRPCSSQAQRQRRLQKTVCLKRKTKKKLRLLPGPSCCWQSP